jgi:tetratricopeptide (TPR) repeat protein/pyruvate-formate lyase-activating enzyme
MNQSLPYILPTISDPELRFKKYLNFLLALLARKERGTKVYSLPFELTLDLSSHCQLSCPYCSVGNKTIRRHPGQFSPDLNDLVLRELGETTFIIWYFSTGEPLLNRKAVEIFKAAQKFEIFTVISTNLSLPLSDERIDDLLGSGLSAICVSLDGVSPESYARYRVGGDFDLVINNLVRLIQRKRALGLVSPLIEWRFLVFRHNESELQQAKAMAARLGVDLIEFFQGYAPVDGQATDVLRSSPNTMIPGPWGPVLNIPRGDTFLRKNLRPEPGYGIVVDPAMRYQKCDWLYLGTTAFPGGSVGPCCVSNDEPNDFGKLEDSRSFIDIWNNERYQAARGIFQGRPDSNIVCNLCPNRDAQDFQFSNTLCAVLRNAPEWVIGIISQAPDRFFWEIDKLLLPHEMAMLIRHPSGLKPEVEDIERLNRTSPDDDWTSQQIELIKKLLKLSADSYSKQDQDSKDGNTKNSLQASSSLDDLTEKSRSISTDESSEIIYQKVQEIIKEDRFSEAVTLLENLITSGGEEPLWHNDLGCLHYAMGDMPRARDCFEKAVRLDSTLLVALKNLADFYSAVEGRIEEAIELYQKVLAQSPDDIETQMAVDQLCSCIGHIEDADNPGKWDNQ